MPGIVFQDTFATSPDPLVTPGAAVFADMLQIDLLDQIDFSTPGAQGVKTLAGPSAPWRHWVKIAGNMTNAFMTCLLQCQLGSGARFVSAELGWSEISGSGFWTDNSDTPGSGAAILALTDATAGLSFDISASSVTNVGPGYSGPAGFSFIAEQPYEYLVASPSPPFWFQLRAVTDTLIRAELWSSEPTDALGGFAHLELVTSALHPVSRIILTGQPGAEGNPPQFTASGYQQLDDWTLATPVPPVVIPPGLIVAGAHQAGFITRYSQ